MHQHRIFPGYRGPASLSQPIERKASGRPHETLFWRTDSYRVVRHFDWKLQITEIPKKDWL